jgi:acyl dehydratase
MKIENSHPREPVFLEDLQAGQRFRTASYRLEERQIIDFARQFDPQPFHLGRESAQGTFFDELVASGWHTAAITMRLLVESGLPIAGGIVGAGAEIAWPMPTRPGDTLHVESEIVEIKPSRSRPDRGVVVLRNETYNQNGQIVQVQTARLVVPRRAPAGGQ